MTQKTRIVDELAADVFSCEEAAYLLECSSTEVRRRADRGILERYRVMGDNGLASRRIFYRIADRRRDELPPELATVDAGRHVEPTVVASEKPRNQEKTEASCDVLEHPQAIILLKSRKRAQDQLALREGQLARVKVDNASLRRLRRLFIWVGSVGSVVVVVLACFGVWAYGQAADRADRIAAMDQAAKDQARQLIASETRRAASEATAAAAAGRLDRVDQERSIVQIELGQAQEMIRSLSETVNQLSLDAEKAKAENVISENEKSPGDTIDIPEREPNLSERLDREKVYAKSER